MDQQNQFNPQNQKMNTSQKLAIGFLAFFSFFIIVIWGWSMSKDFSSFSFVPSENENENQEQQATCAGPDCIGDEEAMRLADSDEDGISDWDELNVYGSSPYIADSDSDGIEDGKEVRMGSDPSCPVGVKCAGEENFLGSETAESGQSGFQENISGQTGQNSSVGTQTQTSTDISELRSFLIENGIDKNLVDRFSDQQLLDVYETVLENQN